MRSGSARVIFSVKYVCGSAFDQVLYLKKAFKIPIYSLRTFKMKL